LEDGRDEGGKFKADFDCFRLLAAFLEAPKINQEKPMASLAIYIYRSTSGFRGLCAFLTNKSILHHVGPLAEMPNNG